MRSIVEHEIEGVTAFKIIDKEMVSEDEAIITLYASGIEEAARFRLRREGADWKFDGPVKGPVPDRHLGRRIPRFPLFGCHILWTRRFGAVGQVA